MNGGIVALVFLVIIGIITGIYFMDRSPEVANYELDSGFGILESEIIIDNIYPGWSGKMPLTILCGKDKDRIFGVSITQPNPEKLKIGYIAFPEEYYPWIMVPKEPVFIKAGESKELEIQVAMPSWEVMSGKMMEARIRVYEANPAGLVQIGIESRWYIIIASEDS